MQSSPLPRDISRFRKLSPDPRAVIREDAEGRLNVFSTAELVVATVRPVEGA